MINKAKLFTALLIIITTLCFCRLKQSADSKATKQSSEQVNDTIPKPVGYVNDFENLLSPVQEQILDSIVTAYEKQSSVEIAILTFDTGMTARNGIEKFTLEVLNTWGVGKKEKNNGILIAVCSGYRFVRIENGYGIEKIMTDKETKKIIDIAILPFFKEGKYYDGILAGVNMLIKTLNEKMKVPANK